MLGFRLIHVSKRAPGFNQLISGPCRSDRDFWTLLVPCLLLIGSWKILMKFWISNFQANLSDWWLGYFLWNSSQQNVSEPDDKSTLVQVMAWCRQATSHCLNRCWPYGNTRPQWVNPSQYNSIKDLVRVDSTWGPWHELQWASFQIRKIAACACTGNAGNIFPATDFKGNR